MASGSPQAVHGSKILGELGQQGAGAQLEWLVAGDPSGASSDRSQARSEPAVAVEALAVGVYYCSLITV